MILTMDLLKTNMVVMLNYYLLIQIHCVIKKVLKHETYKEILESSSKMYSRMKVIRSQKHRIYTMDINKVSLSAYDDKRWITDDGISSFAYGHFRIPNKIKNYEEL